MKGATWRRLQGPVLTFPGRGRSGGGMLIDEARPTERMRAMSWGRVTWVLGVVAASTSLLLAAPGAQAAPPPTNGWVLGLGFESVQGGVVHDASPSAFTGVLRGTTPAVTAP